MPDPEDLPLQGLALDPGALAQLFSIDPTTWEVEGQDAEALFARSGDPLPPALTRQLQRLGHDLSHHAGARRSCP